MISSACNTIYSSLPSFNKENLSRLAVGAIGMGAYWLTSSAPLALITMGTSYLVKKVAFRAEIAQSIKSDVSILLSAPQGKAELPQSIKSNASILLNAPQGKAAMIRNQANSCFCSSVLWSFFANEPTVLEQLPQAVMRRVEALRTQEPIRAVLSQKTSVDWNDFVRMQTALHRMEDGGFPVGAVGRSLKELLSLLELHCLIREFQNTDEMQGNRVNAMRKMTERVNSNFEGTGTRLGDAQEVFQILADLIFEGSPYEQRFTEINPVGKKDVLNWGYFQLPLKKLSLGETLGEAIAGNQFQFAPPFLALNLQRGLHGREDFSPVDVQEKIILTKKYFKSGDQATYELVGVSRRLSSMAHYDAFWKRGGDWYYGDDLKSVFPFDANSYLKGASETGYLFIYRRSV